MESESNKREFRVRIVEVLVVVVLLVIGISLLLPGIQTSREAARRAGCKKHFKQLGLAFHNMESATGHFPSSCRVKRDAEGSIVSMDGWSWCVDILPYMEKGRLYDTLDTEGGVPLEPNADGTTSHADALACVLYGQFQCPSFEGSPYVDSWTETEAITNYKVMGASHMESLNVASPNPTVPRYAPDSDRHPDGVSYPGSRHGISDISDSTSWMALLVESVEQNAARWTVGNETCVVGLPPVVTFERSGVVPYWHPTGYTSTFWSNSTIPAAINRTYLNWDYDASLYDDGGISTPSEAGPIKYGPSSHHVGVTMHGFADGSAHAIDNNIDAALYMFLTGRNNGDLGPIVRED